MVMKIKFLVLKMSLPAILNWQIHDTRKKIKTN